jgi:hypothetical protein
MKLHRRKWLLGVMMFALQLGSAMAANAQSKSNDQAQTSKNVERAICHFTGDASSPYKLITIASGASHSGHGDVKPENGACPSVLPISWSGRSGKDKTARRNNKGEAGGSATVASSTTSSSAGTRSLSTSTETSSSDEGKKVAICHRESNGEYHLNTVSENALPAHLAHGDMHPDGEACESGEKGGTAEPGATPEPISMLLFGAGVAGVGYIARRRRSHRRSETI